MGAGLHRLTDRAVRASRAGMRSDGVGLYLRTDAEGRRRWVFVKTVEGRRVDRGPGSYPLVSLAEARERAALYRAEVAAGRDPRGRDAEDGAPAKSPARGPLFGAYAEHCIGTWEGAWRNPTHRQQWRSTLATHAGSLAGLPLTAVETKHIVAVLRPLWGTVPETATRLAVGLSASSTRPGRKGSARARTRPG